MTPATPTLGGFAFSNAGGWLARAAALAPGRPALVTRGRTYTYSELDDHAARCASVLAETGIGLGDRVGVFLGNGREYVDLFTACARLGAVLVPLSTRLTAPELEYLCTDAGIRTLVYDGALAETVKAFTPATDISTVFAVGDADDPSYEAAISDAAPRREMADVTPDDVVAIFYTSGTTGRPKGAMLTHGNFFWTNLNMLVALDVTRDEKTLVILPMFHVGGWNVNTLSVWIKGGCVYLEDSFDADRVLSLIESDGITSLMGVPAIYQMLADHPRFESADLSSVRICVCGGAPLPVELIRRYHARGLPFTQGYGLTEAAPNCLIVPPEHAEAKAGAAGRPYFFADVRVFDADDAEVGPGAIGEVVVSGPSVMRGYWRLPEESATALRGGWLRTGDVGRVDEDGFIYIVDRVKDMFISGGENVYPAEVENVLAAHPDVVEAAVIGVADEHWGEVGRAIVVRCDETTSAEDLTEWCKERLASFKVPKSFVFGGPLPRNATGKLLKKELRAEYGVSS